MTAPAESHAWPSLPFEAWRDTCETLHMWLQIVGKVALALHPWVNHSWHIAFSVTARGLQTRLLPCGGRALQIEFDFVRHLLWIRVSDGRASVLPLEPQTTAAFYAKAMTSLHDLGVTVRIRTTPCELADAIPFDQDDVHHAYDPEYAHRYWRVLASSACVFQRFRGRFAGKCSPVHFFWGSADLAVTRFSGLKAPAHPGGVPNLADWVTREAYSHEVSSAGFWAGGAQHPHPVFYSYAYPKPPGFAGAVVAPAEADYSTELSEFVLPYDAVRSATAPQAFLLEFLQSTYDAASTLGGWDRSALEFQQPAPVQSRSN